MKTILYLGIDKPDPSSKFKFDPEKTIILHYPIIKIIPRPRTDLHDYLKCFSEYSHIIFTSKAAVHLTFDYLQNFSFPRELISQKQYIAVGKNTAKELHKLKVDNVKIATEEIAEGVIDLLKTMDLTNSYLFWPHSSLSRDTLKTFFLENNLRYKECILYDTYSSILKPLPDFSVIDEIVFTSPSTVDAFFNFFKDLNPKMLLTAIGPITKLELEKRFSKNQ